MNLIVLLNPDIDCSCTIDRKERTLCGDTNIETWKTVTDQCCSSITPQSLGIGNDASRRWWTQTCAAQNHIFGFYDVEKLMLTTISVMIDKKNINTHAIVTTKNHLVAPRPTILPEAFTPLSLISRSNT